MSKMFSFNSVFIYNNNNINNAVLRGVHASPEKDLTSDNNSSFAMGRQEFMRTYNSTQSLATQHQKKWISHNRDASQIVDKRRTTAMGVSLNSSAKPMAYMTKNNENTIREALKRTRSGGSAVPAKKIHQGKNQPVFY
jgi:hypothetical protein